MTEGFRQQLSKFQGGRVLLEKDEVSGIARIILDRPEKCNALSGQMMVELRDCVEDLERWDSGKGVILSGRGKHFCSGIDLSLARNSPPLNGAIISKWVQDALVRLERLPLVSCCLVHGACLGGGSELSMFCDYVAVGDDVKYGFVQGKMGVTTAWGGGTRLSRKIGQRKALELLLTSKVMDAQECLSAGVADVILSSEEGVVEWLRDKLCRDPQITRALKSVVNNTRFYDDNECLARETSIFAPFWGGNIHKEILDANVKH